MAKPKLILVVEDDADIRFAVCSFLESEGYAVAAAHNGLEALDWLKQGQVPDLILLDMLMPKMDGWQFAEALRKNFSTEIPIIVMTAAADGERRAQAVRAVSWVSKPFSLDTFLAKVEQVLLG